MCGIAGWYDPGPSDGEARLARMCDTIRHRGPDDAGQVLAGPVAIGVRRLSIVDIAGGHQPMTSPDGRVTLAFNGEIYNHRELRRELQAAGRVFRTGSDTEVILALYERDGLKAVHRLNGMFAIAVYDRATEQLHLVRDRLGVKPLYYHVGNGRLTFGSEIKAILAGLDRRPDIDPRALWDYLTFRFVPAPGTVWRGISKLPPAHWLSVGRDGAPKVERYWDIPTGAPRLDGSDDDIIADFADLLADSVALRMLADVPVGILLSGGLDSSVVAALAGRSGGALATFAVGFKGEPAIDETPYARLMAQHLGARHAEILIDADDFRAFLPDLVYWTDEPLADLAAIPLHYVCRLARKDVKVVLSGEGSDEILGGYSFDAWARRWDEARSAAAPAHELDLRQWIEPLTMTNYHTSDEKRLLLRGSQPWPDSLDPMRTALRRIGDADTLDQALYVYCQDWLVEDLLMKADRMSMANSLELRTPYLDYRVVEYVARMPARLRVGRDAAGVYRTKLALRRIAGGLVPRAIVERPKLGFPVPAYDWLSGRLQDWARQILLDPATRLRDWFEPAALARVAAAGTAADAGTNERHRVWNLIILEIWLQRWLAERVSLPSPG